MKVTVPVYADVDVIPHGKRKPRRYTVRTETTVQIPEYTDEEMPVALKVRHGEDTADGVRPSQEPTVYRWDGEERHAPVYTRGKPENERPVTAASLEAHDSDLAAMLFGPQSAPYLSLAPNQSRFLNYDRLTEELGGGNVRIADARKVQNAVENARVKASAYCLVDGTLYRNTPKEPVYVVRENGEQSFIHVQTMATDTDASTIYAATDYEGAVTHLMSLQANAGVDGAGTSAVAEEAVLDRIEVNIPEAVTYKPEPKIVTNALQRAARFAYVQLEENPAEDLAVTYCQLQKAHQGLAFNQDRPEAVEAGVAALEDADGVLAKHDDERGWADSVRKQIDQALWRHARTIDGPAMASTKGVDLSVTAHQDESPTPTM